IDWHWFSTMYGVYYFAGCLVSFYAFLSILVVTFRKAGYMGGAVTVEHQHDVGKLFFGHIVFWAYIAFSQFVLIWYGNIPEETIWFAHRWEGSWKPISIFLAAGHFWIPFFFLMSRWMKRWTTPLLIGACWILFMHYVDLAWQILPNFHHGGYSFTVTDLTAFLGVGGLFLAGLGVWMKSGALVPVKDPRLPESLAFENF
ncbi:MAG: hypothetical protein KDA28_14410, partial [Phycisphaerales bacterium]|nr:hypothetical protein [Phycisphaerales bacterium]